MYVEESGPPYSGALLSLPSRLQGVNAGRIPVGNTVEKHDQQTIGNDGTQSKGAKVLRYYASPAAGYFASD